MVDHEWRTGMGDSSCSFPARLSRITPLSVLKKLEDQASNRKILREEAYLLCSPRKKHELDPAFQMLHPIPHIDDIYSHRANMRNASVIPGYTCSSMLKISNPFGDLSGSIQLHQPQKQPQGHFLPAFSFTKHTERHKPNPLAENRVKQSLKRDSGCKD